MANSENGRGSSAPSTIYRGAVKAVCAVALVFLQAGAVSAEGTETGLLTEEAIEQLINTGRYPQAEAAARELLSVAEAEHGPTSRAAVDARDVLVAALIANGRAFEPGTRELAERAVELRLGIDDAEALATTWGLVNLGRVLKDNRQLDEAGEMIRHALEIREGELGPNDLEIARILNELGSVAYRRRDPDLAEMRYGRALTMLEATVGGDHPECAVSLTGLSASMVLRRQLPEAERYRLRSLDVRRSALGPGHPMTAESMRALAVLWHRMGKDQQAEALLRQAVDTLEKSLGPEHPQTGSALNSLAIQVRDQGEYTEARGLFERALEAFETSLDPLDPRIAGVLNNLAAVHRELGDFTEAEACLRRSLAIREARFGPDHPAVAQSLGNLAAVLVEAERHAEAIPLLERALVIKERAYGRVSVKYAVSLACLGRALRATGDLEGAERTLEEVVAIFEGQLGPDHPMVADQLANLALVRHGKGDLEAARAGLLRAIEIRRGSEGEDHPYIGRFQYNLARVEADDGRAEQAVDLALRAEASGRVHLQLTARGLAEDEAIGFDQYKRNRLDLVLAFAIRWPRYSIEAWDALIRSRGLVLNELVGRRRVADSDDPEILTLYDELAAAAERAAKLSIRGVGNASPEDYREELVAAHDEVERLERSLGEASAAFRRDQARSRAGFDEVAASLPKGTALVGITKRSIFNDPTGTRTPDTFDYVAMVLAPGMAEPRPVVLGAVPEIDALVLGWRGKAARAGDTAMAHSTAEAAYRRVGEALRRRIWDPLEPFLKNAEMVFVVPDGELGLVNLATLPVGGSKYLIETGPLIHMLDEERDLVSTHSGRILDDESVLLALGDPDFDWEEARPHETEASEPSRELRGGSGSCGSLDGVVFRRLPSTRLEIENIVSLWRHCSSPDGAVRSSSSCRRTALRLTGPGATEAEFKRLAPGTTVLHLATHGFVLDGRCEAGSATGRGVGGIAPAGRDLLPVRDPIADSPAIAGLALAGANHRMEVGPDDEDGIITAAEIVNLDLSGVEWAVLSACDSGVGESVSGEGIFGFRRAFRVAGAGTVIMSLWPVEDASGQAWMESLYRARLMQGMNTAESVRHASLTLLRERREEGLSTHPFYWGAFVAAGDWR